jgi:alkylation response protein AidB-like acyl-CoA dehydrogenase
MEMTISRDRWQDHLKTRGRLYHDAAVELERLDRETPTVGAGVAALASHALAELLERARAARLTRFQHVQLRLGELIALAESAASLARRAASAVRGTLPEKTDTRFEPAALAAVSRVHARTAAMRILDGGMRWIVGAGSGEDAAMIEQATQAAAIHRAQAGLVADMDLVADALYGRTPRA